MPKAFITSKDAFPPITCHVFDNYDKLDKLAVIRGYHAVECGNDDRIGTVGAVGMQNSNLHSGWVATMGDSTVSVDAQLQLLRDKIKECETRGETVIIGFAQTGNFSVGYSIYIKDK